MTGNRNWMFCGVAALAVVAQASPAAAQSLEARRPFNVSAQPVADALITFSRQSSVQIVTASAGVGSRRSRGVSGMLTVRAALTRLLEGTGLVWRETSPGSVVVEPSAAPVQMAAVEGETIMVTGSRIRRPNLDSVTPVASVAGEEFFQTGQISAGDVLNELPQLRSTVTQSNSTRFLIGGGLNLADLRGLGTQRTLVLQNGRRHVPGDILISTASPDLNAIPIGLVERVDIVTGGSSAVYGSDAIAGVVNFVLRRNFEGVQARAQTGFSNYGDAGQSFANLLAGTNFADGRGNVVVNLEYGRQEEWFASWRPNLRVQGGFLLADSDPPGSPNGSDGIPDRRFVVDGRLPNASEGGTFLDTRTLPFFTAYIFQPNSTIVPQTGERIGLAPFGAYLHGNGNSDREGRRTQIVPDMERYSANLLAHYTVSEAFEPFVEAKYIRIDALNSVRGPFNYFGFTSPRERFYTTNPFLSEQARQFFRNYYGDANANGILDSEERGRGFMISQTLTGLGNREDEVRRETYRIVGGVRGDFNEDWSYEVSANYGQVDERTRVNGNVNLQRWLLAIDAVRDPATGNIVCRAQIDPSARIAFEAARNAAFAQARLAEDVAQCVPINVFGVGNVTDAARNYLIQDTVANGRLTQFVLNAFVSGDSSQWFRLPGGPLAFALGAEYRRETVFFQEDPLVEAGLTNFSAIPTFNPPAFGVKEVFGEIRAPLLARRPFFEELTLSAAARFADYRGATGTVFAGNAGLEWAPVRDIRFRANYSQAVRAPNLTDLYFPFSQSTTGLPNDPCASRNVGAGAATRQANCRADGVPTAFNFTYTSPLAIRVGGNPNLREETSRSLTLGAIVQPRFLPGFSLSVDYYDIIVDDVIATVTAQQIVEACYDAASIDNQFCDLFERAGAGGGPRGEEPGRILEGSLSVAPVNYAKLEVRGIDVEAAYRRHLSGIGDFSTRFTYTHALQNDQFLFPTDPTRANQVLLETGDPRDDFNWNVELRTGPFTFGYQMRYLGPMLVEGAQYEDFFSKQGRPPQNEDFAERRFYPSLFYHDIRVGVDTGRNLDFYFGIDDVTNRQPPFGRTSQSGNNGIFRVIGRFFYVGAVVQF